MAQHAEIITTEQGLAATIEEMAAAARFSLDVESDGFHSYSGRVCIVTLSTESRDVVLDTLALGPLTAKLGPLLAHPTRPCLMHSGNNDVLALRREFSFDFGLIQDTSVAATLLGYTHTGLSALCEAFLGFSLAKDLQRYDWSRRPILAEHLDYLVNDTKHLFKLHDLVRVELEKHQLIDEYEIECRVVAGCAPIEREFDPERFRRIGGVLDLDDAGRGALRELYSWRNGLAKTLDRAAFRVVSDGALFDIARARPADLSELARIRGVGEWLLGQGGDEILAALKRGLEQPAPERGARRPPTSDNGERMSARQRDRLGRLKQWRDKEARARGIGLQAILPTAVLHDLVLEPPADVDALAQIWRVGKSRAARYGEQILKLVRGK